MSKSSATSTGRSSPSATLCLGIESTAHTFGVSLVEGSRADFSGKILSDVRRIYMPPPGSGIHPRDAARHHTATAASALNEALEVAHAGMADVDVVAFSAGPGLGPCLRVGAVVARTLAGLYKKTLVPVNHAVGHIELALMLTGSRDPVVLLVSGGHTLISAFSVRRWKVFGETLDLTVGQLLDQFGRALGFASPCGGKVEALSRTSSQYLLLPYSVKGNDVSFSGVLTASKKLLAEGARAEDVAYSLQETAFAMLAEATERALAFCEKKEVLLVGGVAANIRLKAMMDDVSSRHGAHLHTIPQAYSGDCGAQIGWTGLIAYEAGVAVDIKESRVDQSWRLDTVDVPWRS